MTSFQARARTVDMLGRQQIAGVPTAISELFKSQTPREKASANVPTATSRSPRESSPEIVTAMSTWRS